MAAIAGALSARDDEVRAAADGPVDEQPDGVVLLEGLDGDLRRVGDRQRRHAPRDLARQVERLTAGRQDAQGRAAPEERIDRRRRVIEQVFAVVDDEQCASISEPSDHGVEQLDLGGGLHPEDIGDRCQHRARLTERRELDVPDAIGVDVDEIGGDLQGEAGLPAAAGSGQREQSGVLDQGMDLGEIRLAADERSELCRQVVGHLVDAPERTEHVGEVRVAHLEDLLGSAQVLESVRPQVPEVDLWGEGVGDHLGTCPAREHLAAMAQLADSCGADDRLAHVVLRVAQPRLAAVERHPHPDLDPGRPRLCEDRPLRGDRGGYRVGAALERGDDAVSLALLERQRPTMGADRVVQQVVVALDDVGHLLGMGLPEMRRALEVGQEEGHDASRQGRGRARIRLVLGHRVGHVDGLRCISRACHQSRTATASASKSCPGTNSADTPSNVDVDNGASSPNTSAYEARSTPMCSGR